MRLVVQVVTILVDHLQHLHHYQHHITQTCSVQPLPAEVNSSMPYSFTPKCFPSLRHCTILPRVRRRL